MKAKSISELVQGMLGKEPFCRADPCFSTPLRSLTDLTCNIGCFQPEALQTCLFSALFVFNSAFYQNCGGKSLCCWLLLC